MAMLHKVLLPLLVGSALADRNLHLPGAQYKGHICDDASSMECLMDTWAALRNKGGDNAAEKTRAVDEAKRSEQARMAQDIASLVFDLTYLKALNNSGVLFLYGLLACLAAVICTIVGGQMRRSIFGYGPVKVSSEAVVLASDHAMLHPDALMLDSEGQVLAARAAELSVPFDQALSLSTKQWESIRRVNFARPKDGENGQVSISSNVIERIQEGNILTLQLASGRFLRIDGHNAALVGKDGVQRQITAGSVIMTQFHVFDSFKLQGRKQNLVCENEVEL